MTANPARESDEHKIKQHEAEHSFCPELTPALTDNTGSYSSALFGDPRLSERGNSSAYSAVMQKMQGTHGNRSVQRALGAQRSLPSTSGEANYPQDIGSEGGPLPDDIAHDVETLRPLGRPLDSVARTQMEDAFGEGLDEVRIHVGEQSDALNRRIGANAFTTGSDIFFRDGADPSDTRLLAHELTHVIQQRGASADGPLSVAPADSYHELEAHSAASNIIGGASAQVHTSSGPSIARDLFDGFGVGDWKFKPTFSGSTDSRYDNPENRRRAEMKDADKRSNDPSPPNWWEKPKYDPNAPLPWMPKTTSPGGTVAPPKSPDEGNSSDGPGDYPEDTSPEDEEYA